MVRVRKRITRKEISQPDQFITFTSRCFRFFAQYRARILLALSLVIAAFLTIWGFSLYSAHQNRLAAREYSRALTAYRGGKYLDALDGFARLSAYRRSDYSRLALLYSAQSHIALKQPSEAVPVLQEFLEKERVNPYLRQLALVTLGYVHEKAGNCPQAVKAFTEARNLIGPLREDALLATARCSSQNGDLMEALHAYKAYLSSFPVSPRTMEVRLRIQEIEAKMKGVAGSK